MEELHEYPKRENATSSRDRFFISKDFENIK
jgi:hypothetical protein